MSKTTLTVVTSLFAALYLTSSAFGEGFDPPTNLRLGTTDSPTTTATMPLSWDDPAFSNVTTSGALTLSSGAVRSHLSITESGANASIQCNGSCDLDHIRISSREGVRCVSGTLNINSMWIEAKGLTGDHADGLQCYSPGSTGANTIKNTTFRAYTANATAGYWSADGWKGTHRFENVLFWGGPYGLRIPYDGGSAVYLKDVYFVTNSFGYGPFLFDKNSSGTVPILQWENVRWATIMDGKLVPGALIPKPN